MNFLRENTEYRSNWNHRTNGDGLRIYKYEVGDIVTSIMLIVSEGILQSLSWLSCTTVLTLMTCSSQNATISFQRCRLSGLRLVFISSATAVNNFKDFFVWVHNSSYYNQSLPILRKIMVLVERKFTFNVVFFSQVVYESNVRNVHKMSCFPLIFYL